MRVERDLAKAAAVPLAVWLLAACYAWLLLDRGWVPHDEGALAQSAIRVLAGEVPHRDFHELYTGGLTYLNALAFQLLGIRLLAPRYMLFAAFLLWIPLIFWILTHFVGRVSAGGSTLLAAVWSLPNYPAAMPSWYNLFLTTAGIAALFKYLDTGARAWLLLAGVCGGVSFLFKLVGLYFLASCFLFIAFHEQTVSRGSSRGLVSQSAWYRLILVGGLAGFMSVLVVMMGPRLGLSEAVHFLIPPAILALLLLVAEAKVEAASRQRLATIFRLVVPILVGFALPTLALIVAAGMLGALGDLWKGLFARPSLRLHFAAVSPPSVVLMLPTLVVGSLVVASRYVQGHAARLLTLVSAAGFGWLLWDSAERVSYLVSWYAISQAVPLTVLLGAAVIAGSLSQPVDVKLQRLMVVLCALATTNLVQFPFAAPIYFAYVAPLLIVALAGMLSTWPSPSYPVIAVLVLFFGAFAVLRVTPGFIYNMGRMAAPSEYTALLDLPRGGIRVTPAQRMEYAALVNLLHAHAGGGAIYAGPDSPEVYFLSGLPNRTKTLFEFFDEDLARPAGLLDVLEGHGMRVVVINTQPAFSRPHTVALLDTLKALFPHDTVVGRFSVRWKE